MPFVTDIYPPTGQTEAVAGLALAVSARKGKGFPGKRQYEAVEVLSRFLVPLRTVVWERGEESCTGLLVDPQGLLTGSVRFDLTSVGPQAALKDDMGEEDFIALCQQVTKTAADFSAETMEITGLITEPEEARPLFSSGGPEVLAAALEQTVDSGQVTDILRKKLAEYGAADTAWVELKQNFFAFRDRHTEKIKDTADQAREAGSKSLEELEQQVKAAIASKRQETEGEREKAKAEHQKQKGLLQSEIERFQEQFRETGEEYWRDKIKAEEQRMAESDKKLAGTLDQLHKEELKYTENQQARIKQFIAAGEKRLASFDQRLKLLNAALSGLEKSIDKRLDGLREQHKKIAGITLSLSTEQCDQELPVVLYAARYPGDRWVIFPPQLFGRRGVRGVFTSLIGGINLPFRPAAKVGETLAAKLQALLPGHSLESMLVEQNLLKDPDFISDAKKGLAELIDQGEISKKQANLFDDF